MATEAETAREHEVNVNRARNHLAGVVLASVVLVLVGLLNLPYTYVQVGDTWLGITEDDEMGVHSRQSLMPTMAGWPFGYWIRYPHGDVMEDRFWSTGYLVLNLVLGACLALAVYGYMLLRAWKTGTARNPRLTQTLFDCGTALAILLVPAIVIALEHREASKHWRVARQLARFGNSQMACWLPAPLAEQFPQGLRRSFSRLRMVHLNRPDQQMVRAATSLHSVILLQCERGEFDAAALEPLIENRHFFSLRLSGRELSDADIDVISRLPHLRELGLRGSNVDGPILRRLDHLDRLTMVDLTGTPLQLSELGTPAWSNSVTQLNLTRPLRGGGSLTIDGWPRLKYLSVERFSTRLNDSVLQIRLSNLPELKALSLNRVQKHHLSLVNTPRLTVIDEGLAELQESLGTDAYVPGLTWVTSLEVDGASSLSDLGCYAQDLEHLSIRNMPHLQSFSLGSFLISGLSEPIQQSVDQERCEQWIRYLGSWEGPGRVDLTGLPLEGVDVSPLANNPRVRELIFRDSNVSIEQLGDLGGLDRLERLDIRSTPLREDELSWLLKQFPNLKDLAIDATHLKTFVIKDNTTLRRIQTTRLGNAVDVHLADIPRLHVGLRIARAPGKLTIRNAPVLVGIAVEGVWPENAEVSGLRQLEWFAGGGPALDDKLMRELLRCEKIDQLTLAYPSISREMLAQIGRFEKLSLLAVPGADVDDEVTANWRGLKTLWEINLDDTAVSAGTIAWLSSIESLRRVSLNRVTLTSAAADALGQLGQLGELQLAGSPIDPQRLLPLLAEGNLDSIDLSGWPVDDALLEFLENASSLRHLVLRGSEIDADSLRQILASNRGLYVELGELPDFVDDPMAAELRARRARTRRSLRAGWRQPLRPNDRRDLGADDTSLKLSLYEQSEGRIETLRFRPVLVAEKAAD